MTKSEKERLERDMLIAETVLYYLDDPTPGSPLDKLNKEEIENLRKFLEYACLCIDNKFELRG